MRLYVIIMLTLCCQALFSQGFKVKGFEQSINDGSAFRSPMDANGHPCGLIKVRSDNTGLIFMGDIVGDVDNKTNEYWVFMASGSKQLDILHPNFLPMHIDFNTYGIGEVVSKTTYILTLSELKYNKDKTGLVVTVHPETASLYIDDILVDNMGGNDYYQLYLSKGDHICRIIQKGYRPFVQAITTGKGTQTLNVELESVMAELEVVCKTKTAEIYIDGELKGNGSWKGQIYAGNHIIEARQQNYVTNTQEISIQEKESRTFTIPELKREMGMIRVETVPSNIPIIIDGRSIGNSPCTIDVESGKHYVSVTSDGCVPIRSDVEINGGEQQTVKLEIQFSDERGTYYDYSMKEKYQSAYNGNSDDILFIATELCREENYDAATFWIERHPDGEAILKNWKKYGEELDNMYWQCDWIQAYSKMENPEKALEIYNDWKENGGLSLPDLEMRYIGEGFLKIEEYDRAIMCFQQAGEEGYEGLGDCYNAKGNKQLAANYYRKCLNLNYYDGKNRVEKKMKELGY